MTTRVNKLRPRPAADPRTMNMTRPNRTKRLTYLVVAMLSVAATLTLDTQLPAAYAVDTAPSITTASLPAGAAGVVYNTNIAASGSPTPTLSVTAGALPTNLTLSTAGLLSGLPKSAATYSFTVTATNSSGSVAKAFTVVISKPVNLLLNPSQETADPKVIARTNLLNNPSLVNMTGVSGYSGTPLAIETGEPNGIVATGSPANGYQGIIITTTSTNPMPAATYTVSAFVRIATGVDASFSMRLGTPNATESINSVAIQGNDTSWVRVSSTFTTTEARSFIGMQLVNGGAKSTDRIRISQPLVEQSRGSYPFFDGARAYPAINDTSYGWSGAVNNSPSYQYVDEVANMPGYAGSNSVAARSSDWVASGTYSSRIISSGITANESAASDTFLGWGGQPGKTYTILGTSRTIAPLLTSTPGNGNGVNQITAYGLNGSVNVVARSIRPPDVAGVYKQRITVTIPADATYVSIRWYSGVPNGKGEVWWDDLAVIEGDYRGDYFAGATPGATWASTAHASSSSMVTPPVPNLRVVQTVGGVASPDKATSVYKLADETLTWSYLVSNIGTIPISGITVSDDQGVAVNCPGAALNADTAMTCTGTDILGAGLYGIAP